MLIVNRLQSFGSSFGIGGRSTGTVGAYAGRQTGEDYIGRSSDSDVYCGRDLRVGRFRSHRHAEAGRSLRVICCYGELAAFSVKTAVGFETAPADSQSAAGNARRVPAFHSIVAVSSVRRQIENFSCCPRPESDPKAGGTPAKKPPPHSQTRPRPHWCPQQK